MFAHVYPIWPCAAHFFLSATVRDCARVMVVMCSHIGMGLQFGRGIGAGIGHGISKKLWPGWTAQRASKASAAAAEAARTCQGSCSLVVAVLGPIAVGYQWSTWS